jgi:hypothetical protein
MARVDDFQMSFDLAAEKLTGLDFSEVAQKAGASISTDATSLSFSYYGREVEVKYQPVTVSALDEGPELPLAEQALVLHYLVNASGLEPTGEWITYREVPSGEFYWSAFVKRAKSPLVGFFGNRPQLLLDLAPKVGGEKAQEQSADATVLVKAFPKVPILIQLWAGDDEFPPEGNVLFDKTVSQYLPTEDVALAAGLPIYKMMALSRQR